MSTRQERLTQLGSLLMAGTPPTALIPIPELPACELGEWLEGAGFEQQASITVNGDECQVWHQDHTNPWPSFVTVTTDSATGDISTAQYWCEDDVPQDTHDYDPTCRCQICVDEFRVRYEPKGY